MDANAIRGLRNRLNETQVAFGQRFGVGAITVSYWEVGRSRPARHRLDELSRLAIQAERAPIMQRMPFRAIQYLGSKKRLAHTIADVIHEVVTPNARVGDLFAGTGVISHLVGATHPITAVDVQAYSSLLATALLTCRSENLLVATEPSFWNQVSDVSEQLLNLAQPLILFEHDALNSATGGDASKLVNAIEYGSLAAHSQRPFAGCDQDLSKCLAKVNRTLRKSGIGLEELPALYYYGGSYFSYEQAISLDAIGIVARRSSAADRLALQAVLLSTASEVVNTVGKQFAQPIRLRKADGRIQPLLLERTLTDRSRNVPETFRSWAAKWAEQLPQRPTQHRVVCGDVLEFLGKDLDCAAYYADPPYTIDHYSRFYHVLETLVCRDLPHLDEMKKRGVVAVMRGIYRSGRHQSSFCIPSEAPGAFAQLFKLASHRGVPLLLSYSPFDQNSTDRPRLMGLSEIVTAAKQHYRHVDVVEVSEHSHRKLNAKSRNSIARTDAERLLLCRQ